MLLKKIQISTGESYLGYTDNGRVSGFGVFSNPYTGEYLGEWFEETQNGYGIENFTDGGKFEYQSLKTSNSNKIFYKRLMEVKDFKPKSFWERPEGTTGMFVLAALLVGGGILLYNVLPTLISLAENTLYLSGMLITLSMIIYMILDPKMRNLVGFAYKSLMRTITGIFVNLDPIGVLKSYIESLESSLGKMDKQINQLRGQMHKLKELIVNNQKARKHNK